MTLRSNHLALSLNFRVLELLKEMERLKGSFKLHGRILAMLNGVDLEGELRDKIWVERMMNVTCLSKIISTKSNLKSPFELLYAEKATLHDHLKIFGEVGVVTTKDRIQAHHVNLGSFRFPKMTSHLLIL
jgi:hypothetical protein